MNYEIKLKRNGGIPEQELLDDLRSVATKLQRSSLTMEAYEKRGKFSRGVFKRKFASWNDALLKAGLEISKRGNNTITEENLFNNLALVWGSIGRQPSQANLDSGVSKFGSGAYKKKFGSYNNALNLFETWVQLGEGSTLKIPTTQVNSNYVHKTKREISPRLQVQVLIRDGNKCRLCGETVTGEDIHFDHIKPWSKEGETILENIQVLCKKHNLAKGNYDLST